MNFVLGIDFGGTKIALATATPGGEPLRTARIEERFALMLMLATF